MLRSGRSTKSTRLLATNVAWRHARRTRSLKSLFAWPLVLSLVATVAGPFGKRETSLHASSSAVPVPTHRIRRGRFILSASVDNANAGRGTPRPSVRASGLGSARFGRRSAGRIELAPHRSSSALAAWLGSPPGVTRNRWTRPSACRSLPSSRLQGPYAWRHFGDQRLRLVIAPSWQAPALIGHEYMRDAVLRRTSLRRFRGAGQSGSRPRARGAEQRRSRAWSTMAY